MKSWVGQKVKLIISLTITIWTEDQIFDLLSNPSFNLDRRSNSFVDTIVGQGRSMSIRDAGYLT